MASRRTSVIQRADALTSRLITACSFVCFLGANLSPTAFGRPSFAEDESQTVQTKSVLEFVPAKVELSSFQNQQQITVRTTLAKQAYSDANAAPDASPGVIASAHPTVSSSLSANDGLTLEIEPPNIAHLVAGPEKNWIIQGDASGTAKLIATWKTPRGNIQRAETQIVVTRHTEIVPWEFDNHIQPILSKSGCNMGACHGALAGKGGFRLSLRGYDSLSDHFNIAKQDGARRVELSQPENSLLLLKPSGRVEHKGGLRIAEQSSDYKILVDWIAQGARGPQESDARLLGVDVYPKSVELGVGDIDQMTVIATYSDGRSEDVTRWAKFSSSDEAIALVEESGKVRVVGPGEGAIIVWFSSRIDSARLRVAFEQDPSKRASREAIRERLAGTLGTLSNPIDQHIANQLVSLGLMPSQRCTDEEFLRRSSLDATGTLPTAEQVEKFLADEAPDKRARWVDGLLDSPQFVDYWTYRWSDVLMLNSNLLRTDGVKAYYQWIRGSVEQNKPWDVFAKEIVTATGESLENGATNFYGINQDPETMTENACQAFLGLSIGCAKCHNHPLEKWTNDQYYAMANLFARVRAKGWGGEVRNGDSARTVFVVEQGDLIQPLRGKPQPPAPLDAPPIDPLETRDRREVLAQWLTSPENPYFTRAIVNRVWAAYFGIGIVNSVDDMRSSNPESNPELMSSLSTFLIENKYNLKILMREIMNSQTYQRSSEPTDGNQADRKYFSHYYPKRLMAEVIHDAIVSVTSVPSEFNKVIFLGGDRNDTKFYPTGTRAIQLFDSSVESNFLKTFGRNQRRITCECERSDEPSIIQVLHLNNGDTVNKKLAEKGGIVEQWLVQFNDDPAGLVKSAYLRTLCRRPTEIELDLFTQELREAKEKHNAEEYREVVEDFLWSLLSSREFLFNY
jgi:hypothetical protein